MKYIFTPERIAATLAITLLSVTPALGQNSADDRNNNEGSDRYAEQVDRSQSDNRQQDDDSQRSQNRSSSDATANNNQSRDDQSRDQRDRSANRADREQSQANRRQRDEQRTSSQQAQDSAGLGVMLAQWRQGDGVRVERLYSNSPAAKAGIRAGDALLSIDGEQFNSVSEAVNAVREMDPGERVDVDIRRNGETQTLQVQLDQRRDALNLDEPRSQRFADSQSRNGERTSNRGNSSRFVTQRLRELEQMVNNLSNEIDRLQSDLEDRTMSTSSRNRDDREMRGNRRYFDDEVRSTRRNESTRRYDNGQFENDRDYSADEDPSRALPGSDRNALRSRTIRIDE